MTQKNYFTPKFFQKDGSWKTIDTTLIEDKNAGDAGTSIGKAFGAAKSWVSKEKHFVVKDNDWQARFGPSNFSKGLLRVQKGDDQFGLKPVGANKVDPEIKTAK